MTSSQSYEEEIFRPTLLDFGYKDVDNSIIWITEPMNDELSKWIEDHSYVKNQTYYDFFETVYNDQYSNGLSIQPLKYIENKLNCDFINKIDASEFVIQNIHSCSYRVTTEKEIFPILDASHCKPQKEDAIFDFGCGKGGAMLSFLSYGFDKVGGVEYQPDIYSILLDNRKKLKFTDKKMMCIQGDAGEITEQLDEFNWFYFFQPFDGIIMERCLKNIMDSYTRIRREITLILINTGTHTIFEKMGFTLFNQFTVAMRQRVVNIYKYGK